MASNITRRVIAELLERDAKGLDKYGVTLDRTDLSLMEWLQHAKEEALDQACYLDRAIVKLQEMESCQTPIIAAKPND